MSCFDKKAYKYLKQAAKRARNVHVVSDPCYLDGAVGVSIAYRPSIENTNCRMLDVAVSYCSPEDKYKRKHGKYQALKRLAAGEVVKMPHAQLLLNDGPEAVNEVLIAAFTVDY
jgi:hypothetical protein